MPLTDTAIRNAKPQEKPYKLTDQQGLYLLVNEVGKYFRFDYRFGGKRKTLSLGVYPDVRLKEAREEHENARKLLRNGVDPFQHKKQIKNMLSAQATNNFEAVAWEWFAKNKHTWTEGHSRTIDGRLKLNVLPWLGERSIASITDS